MKRPHLDWTDKLAVRHWLRELQAALDDAKSVVEDMLAPRREQHLGQVKHRQMWNEASHKMGEYIAYAMPTADDEIN